MKDKLKRILLVLIDIFVINASFVLALLLRFDLNIHVTQFQQYFVNTYIEHCLIITLVNLLAIYGNKLYESLWKYASLRELFYCGLAALTGTAGVIAYLALINDPLPRSVSIIAMVIEAVGLTIVRFSYRLIREHHIPGMFNLVKRKDETKILLIGAGSAGASIIGELEKHPEENKRVVAAIDDNPEKIGRDIAGVKIVGGNEKIVEAAEKYGADEIVVAIPSASKKRISTIVDICQETKCKVQILPSVIDLVNGTVSIAQLRDVSIEDLLGRDPIKLDLKNIESLLENETVLVTGGGGSIGSELVRQIAKYAPRRIVIFDIYENTTFDIQQEMRKTYPDLDLDVVIGSVVNKTAVEQLFKQYRPGVVFHAAAHKHVPLMEDTPFEAVLNNVQGTNNVMDAAENFGAKNFILISTDKAVNPTSVMGATKRICEMLMQEHAAKSTKCKFVAVRFGNVLGSNGSVIPTFKKQIQAGGPVTVTHKEITRFFMTIPEAVQLVMQAGSMAGGGEIFILDMGQPVKILDLAEKLIRLAGFTPYEDIEIKFTGLRPGEKLYEELLLSEEGIKETSHDQIFIGHPVPASEALKKLLESGLEAGIDAHAREGEEEIRQWIKKMVPNYLGVKE